MKNIQLIIIALCFLIGCQGVSDNLAADYDELVSLFNEFREYQKPILVDGIPDYSEGTMKAKLEGVRAFQQRLEDMDTTEWSTSSQVDYYLVWAEMNLLLSMLVYHALLLFCQFLFFHILLLKKVESCNEA